MHEKNVVYKMQDEQYFDNDEYFLSFKIFQLSIQNKIKIDRNPLKRIVINFILMMKHLKWEKSLGIIYLLFPQNENFLSRIFISLNPNSENIQNRYYIVFCIKFKTEVFSNSTKLNLD